MIRSVAIVVALCALSACDREEPLPVGIRKITPVTACEVQLPSDLSADAVYRLARQVEGMACEVGPESTLIFPVNRACDEEAATASMHPVQLGLEQMSAKLEACNVTLAPRQIGGRFSTLIYLKDRTPSPERARDADIRLRDLARRVPLGARNAAIQGDAACFQYDDADAFRRKLDELARYLPRNVEVRHFDGAQCAAQLIVLRRSV